VLFGGGAVAIYLAELFPLLTWGWLGENIVFSPFVDLISASSGGQHTASSGALRSSKGTSPGIGNILGPALVVALFVPLIVVVLLTFNYFEEATYRESHKHVVVWAVSHLIMGIPIFALLPIFSVGVVYKQIYDRYGLQVAYVAHVGTNLVLLTIIVTGTLILTSS
jgi:hypothetical protein